MYTTVIRFTIILKKVIATNFGNYGSIYREYINFFCIKQLLYNMFISSICRGTDGISSMLSEYAQRTELLHSQVERRVDVLELHTMFIVVRYCLKMDQLGPKYVGV
jgi:hypothetical protein